MATRNLITWPIHCFRLGRDIWWLWDNQILSVERAQGAWTISIHLPDQHLTIKGRHVMGMRSAIHTLTERLKKKGVKTQEQGFRFPERHGGVE